MGLAASQSRLLSLTSRLSDLEFQAQQISNAKIRLADASAQASEAYNAALDKEKLTVLTGINSKTGEYIYSQATANNITNYTSSMDKQRVLKNSYGQVVLSQGVYNALANSGGNITTALNNLANAGIIGADDVSNTAVQTYYTRLWNEITESGGAVSVVDDASMNSPDWLYSQLEAGNVFISVWDNTESKDTNGDGISDSTGDFVEVSWTSGDSSLQTESDKTDLAKAEAEYESTMAEIEAKDSRFDLQLKTIDTEHNAVQTQMDSVQKVMDKNIERTFKIFDA